MDLLYFLMNYRPLFLGLDPVFEDIAQSGNLFSVNRVTRFSDGHRLARRSFLVPEQTTISTTLRGLFWAAPDGKHPNITIKFHRNDVFGYLLEQQQQQKRPSSTLGNSFLAPIHQLHLFSSSNILTVMLASHFRQLQQLSFVMKELVSLRLSPDSFYDLTIGQVFITLDKLLPSHLRHLTLESEDFLDLIANGWSLDLKEQAAFKSLIERLESLKIWCGGFFYKEIPLTWNLSIIQSLNIQGCPLSDISALSTAIHLKDLNLSGSSVHDLTPLSKLSSSLKVLRLNETDITDISPLSQLTSLWFLEIKACQRLVHLVKNSLPPQIESFDMSHNNQIFLENNITAMDHYNPLVCIGSLAGLRYLNLSSNSCLEEISPILNLKHLRTLLLDNTGIRNVSPLVNCTSLRKLSLQRTRNFIELKGSLELLCANNTKIRIIHHCDTSSNQTSIKVM